MGYAQWQDSGAEIRFRVPGSEFRKHCRNRYQFHEARYKILKQQEDRLNAELKDFVVEASKPVLHSSPIQHASLSSGAIIGFNKAINTPIENLTSLRKSHKGQMQLFDFASTHLREKQYNLTESELKKWEFID